MLRFFFLLQLCFSRFSRSDYGKELAKLLLLEDISYALVMTYFEYLIIKGLFGCIELYRRRTLRYVGRGFIYVMVIDESENIFAVKCFSRCFEFVATNSFFFQYCLVVESNKCLSHSFQKCFRVGSQYCFSLYKENIAKF